MGAVLASRGVRVGAMTALLVVALGCASDDETTEVQTEYGEICVRQEPPDSGEWERVADSECDDGHHGRSWIWMHHAGGHTAPPVGSRVSHGSFVTSRPTGSIARPPTSGGFGTRTSSGTGG